jgi:hypothetical protein
VIPQHNKSLACVFQDSKIMKWKILLVFSQGIRTSQIKTFHYYTSEIEKVLASGTSDKMFDTILKYHRQLWKNQTGREVDLGFLNAED